jgi:hypothetical protein
MLLKPLIIPGLAALVFAHHAQAASPDLVALNAAVRPAFAAQYVAMSSPRPGPRAFPRITMMKSAVEGRLNSDGLTGAVGLLCGRQPNRDISGGAGAFDRDPEGKFVGAQLRRAF